MTNPHDPTRCRICRRKLGKRGDTKDVCADCMSINRAQAKVRHEVPR